MHNRASATAPAPLPPPTSLPVAGGGFPFGDMPGGMPGMGRRGGGGPVNNKRYYEVLGVAQDASEVDIKKVGAGSSGC